MADQWTELRQVNDRLERELEAAVARADHLGATLAAMEAGMEARPDSCLRQDELAARHGQRAVIEHVRAALARVPAEPAAETFRRENTAWHEKFEKSLGGLDALAEPATDTCPTCGSPVRVHTGDEGTSSYEPLATASTTEQARRAIERFVLCSDVRLRGGMSYDQLRAYRGLVDALAAIRAPERLKRAHG